MWNLFGNWRGGIKPAPGDKSLSFSVMFENMEVGRLTRTKDEWIFRYSEAFRLQNSLQPIIDFPTLEKEYRSKELWPFFLLRIPSLGQPAVQRLIEQRKVDSVDEGTLLREFGRWSVANPFELVAVS